MRVALLCPYSLDVPGGVGTHVLGLAGWLAHEGHRPLVLAPGTTPVAPPPGVDVELLGSAVGLAFNGSVANLALGRAQARRAVSAAADADVVHVHEPLTPGIAYALARSAAPLVVTHHASFEVPRPLAAVLRRRARRLGPRSALAVSAQAAATARAVTGLTPLIVPNAIALPPPPAARRPGGGPGRVGFLGRLDERRKGFPVFRELARLARQAGLEADFVAAGPGRVDPGPVHLLGQVADRQHYLSGLDVLVAPNLSGESFGMVLVEAMASGCDVVASDLPAFRTLLAEAGVGRTFPTGDAVALLAAVGESLTNPPDRGHAHRSATRWGWDRVGPLVVQAYAARRGDH